MTTERDFAAILRAVLDLIGYSDDKQAFVEKFSVTCLRQALVDILLRLPADKQATLRQQLAQDNSPEHVAALLREHAVGPAYATAVEHATQSAFRDLLDAVIPTLSPTQQEQLHAYLGNITASQGYQVALEPIGAT